MSGPQRGAAAANAGSVALYNMRCFGAAVLSRALPYGSRYPPPGAACVLYGIWILVLYWRLTIDGHWSQVSLPAREEGQLRAGLDVAAGAHVLDA